MEGYGEGVMDPFPNYREETITGALHLLRNAFGPDLVANGCEHPQELTARWAHWRGNPMAKTALELAVWDCYARQQGVPLRTLLGGERTEIPVGASLGMNPIERTVESVTQHVEQGYQRVKLKIEPGWDVELLAAVRAVHPHIELTVDANSAYTLEMLAAAAPDRRVRAALHRAAAALGRPHRPRRSWPRSCAPSCASTRRSPRPPG